MVKCCICDKIFEGKGNNPFPVKNQSECCNRCNAEIVIPARLLEVTCRDKIVSQEKFCIDNKFPMFAPTTLKSFCCNQNIWEKISLKDASTKHLTGCPICSRSWCD